MNPHAGHAPGLHRLGTVRGQSAAPCRQCRRIRWRTAVRAGTREVLFDGIRSGAAVGDLLAEPNHRAVGVIERQLFSAGNAEASGEARQSILGLAEQLPQIWNDPRVDFRERKRIVRLLIDDMTLIKAQKITAHVRLSGGATRTLEIERPLPIAQLRKFKPELVAAVDLLLDQHCDREIADILNRDGWRSWEGKPFNLNKIAFIRGAYKLASRYDRLRRRGMLTTREVATKFGISETTVHEWGRQRLIRKCYTDGLNRGLWRSRPTRLSPRAVVAATPARRGQHQSPRNHQDEVQYEAVALSRGFLTRVGSTTKP